MNLTLLHFKKTDLFPILLGLLCFFTVKLNITGAVYHSLAFIAMCYFGLIRIIFTITDKTLNKTDKTVECVLSYVFSTLIGLSAVLFYIP